MMKSSKPKKQKKPKRPAERAKGGAVSKQPAGLPQRESPPTPGGHALQRLHQFEKQRGLEPSDIVNPQSDPAPPEADETETDEDS
jgi:hypothetical protein